MKKAYIPLILAALLTVGVSAATSAAWQGGPGQGQRPYCARIQKTGMPYGRSVLTQEERISFHQEMLNAKTPAERDALRLQHRKLIQERAQAQGAPTLPGTPGMGSGGGMKGGCPGGGPGFGMGAGMGCRLGARL